MQYNNNFNGYTEDTGMRTITVEKKKLLEILKKNRDSHRSVFEEAWNGYRAESIRVHEQNLALLKSGKKVIVAFYEQAPQDHTKDYDLVIRMLEMDTGVEVELDQQQFSNYVDDEWNWKQQWSTSNAKYSATLAAASPR